MKIIPAIIPKTFEDLEEKLSAVVGLVPLVQVDVLDGSLVPGIRAWPYLGRTRINADVTQINADTDDNFEKIIREEVGFPFWEKIDFEAHLMVRDPEGIILDWIAAGASRVIVQLEGLDADEPQYQSPPRWTRYGAQRRFEETQMHPPSPRASEGRGADRGRDFLQNFNKCVEATDGRVPLGVSLCLDTPLKVLAPVAIHVEVIQLMGWNFSSLGRQGQPFDPHAIDAIRELRLLYPKHIISVDGGVNLENAPMVIGAGADNLVVGSAIWESGMVRDNLEKFKGIIQSNEK